MSSRRSRHNSTWSDWEWNQQEKRYARWRVNGRGAEEWQYGESFSEVDATLDTQHSQPIAESTEDTQSQYQYGSGKGKEATSDVIAETAQQFGSMTLDSSSLNPAPSYSFQRSGDVQSGLDHTTQSSRGDFTNDSAIQSGRTIEGRTETTHQNGSILVTSPQKTPGEHTRRMTRVFKVLWSEPEGTNGTNITTWGGSFKKIRRFVIVRNFEGHCLCLPILTYGGRGTLKPGVHSEDHAVVYSDRETGPILLPGETLSKSPLRMEPNDDSQKLDTTSRVNYAKVYTVEHNVKVFFIGALTRNAQAQLGADYNAQHPPVDEPTPDAGYIVTRPLGRSNSSNYGQQFEKVATTTDRFYGSSSMVNASSSYTSPQDTGPMSNYFDSHDGASVGDSESSTGYTFEQQTAGRTYTTKDQYSIKTQGGQSEEAQTPRRASSPEQAPTILTDQEASEFHT
ncbi:hypothetical protein BKA65DRAFT_477215 [Rhexocercosporidium sp. MPI-PUGE-AT-0058]|nr:hypothetical protein BKA65DRAFT_477215 [Rhexocercosporidium sp. MPI-PUGE-AT-0058]